MEQWAGRCRSKSIKSYNLVPLLKRLCDLMRTAHALSVMMLQQCRDMLLKKNLQSTSSESYRFEGDIKDTDTSHGEKETDPTAKLALPDWDFT